MSIGTNRLDPLMLLLIIFFVVAIAAYPINGLESRKLDEGSVPGDQGIKCTPSCTVQSPPPPPSPPLLPPPIPKKQPTQSCPPPPSPPSFIYITGPPGSLYPVDQTYGAASRRFEVGLLALFSVFLVFLSF